MRTDIGSRLSATILSPALMGSARILNSGTEGLTRTPNRRLHDCIGFDANGGRNTCSNGPTFHLNVNGTKQNDNIILSRTILPPPLIAELGNSLAELDIWLSSWLLLTVVCFARYWLAHQLQIFHIPFMIQLICDFVCVYSCQCKPALVQKMTN